MPGKGIDCIHLVMQAIYGAGVLEPRKLPPYRTRWGLVSPENLMAKALCLMFWASRHKNAVAQYGDIIIWTCGKQSNHCGFVGKDSEGELTCWHVLKGGIVHTTPLKPVVQRAQELLRFAKPGWRLDPPDQLDLKKLNER